MTERSKPPVDIIQALLAAATDGKPTHLFVTKSKALSTHELGCLRALGFAPVDTSPIVHESPFAKFITVPQVSSHPGLQRVVVHETEVCLPDGDGFKTDHYRYMTMPKDPKAL